MGLLKYSQTTLECCLVALLLSVVLIYCGTNKIVICKNHANFSVNVRHGENDPSLLVAHCVVLKSRRESVEHTSTLPADNISVITNDTKDIIGYCAV